MKAFRPLIFEISGNPGRDVGHLRGQVLHGLLPAGEHSSWNHFPWGGGWFFDAPPMILIQINPLKLFYPSNKKIDAE